MTNSKLEQSTSVRVYLNPNTGRFWMMDSFNEIHSKPFTLNKYAYGSGNPINRIDPSGHNDFSMPSFTIAIGGAEGLAGAGAAATTRAFTWAVFRTVTAAIAIGSVADSDESEARNYVYRRLSNDQAATPYRSVGIQASNPTAVSITPEQHILDDAPTGSPWISTSRSPYVPLYTYNNNPENPVVVIDIRRLITKYVDFTNPLMLMTLQSTTAQSLAKRDKEVLIFANVPAMAIVGTIEP